MVRFFFSRFSLASPIGHTKEKCPTPGVGQIGLAFLVWIGDRIVGLELNL